MAGTRDEDKTRTSGTRAQRETAAEKAEADRKAAEKAAEKDKQRQQDQAPADPADSANTDDRGVSDAQRAEQARQEHERTKDARKAQAQRVTGDRGSDDPMDIAAAELRGPNDVPGNIAYAFPGAPFNAWVESVRGNNDLMINPDEPATLAPREVLTWYGEGDHDYIVTTFESGEVVVRDGNDPTGKAWKYSNDAWRRFAARVRGEDPPVER